MKGEGARKNGNNRMHRVNRLIQESLAEILPDVRSPLISDLPPSITAVRTSPDLHQARIYVSALGDPIRQREIIAALKESAGFIRGELGRRVRLRFTPSLEFVLDETLESASHIEQMLREIADEQSQSK